MRFVHHFLYVVVSVYLLGCSTPGKWVDADGGGRGQAAFNRDSGNCQLLSQQTGFQQQSLVNQQNVNGCYGTNAQCGTLGLLQGLTVGAAKIQAYQSCMQARGWSLQQEQSERTAEVDYASIRNRDK